MASAVVHYDQAFPASELKADVFQDGCFPEELPLKQQRAKRQHARLQGKMPHAENRLV